MSKAFQLQVPKPCHQKWDQMTQADKGRFCSSCQKQVIDFTRMSERELVAFFKKPSTGSVCGRFNNDQLNKELEIPRKRIPWLKYFFTIALPTFLASSKAVSQGQAIKIQKSDTVAKTKESPITLGYALPAIKCVMPKIKKTVEVINMPEDFILGDVDYEVLIEEKNIAGKVIDENGKAVVGATILIKGTNSGTVANAQGQFTLKSTNADSLNIIISCVGFETKEQIIHANKQTNITLIEMVQLKTATLGALVITKCFKPAKPIPLISRIFKDTAFKNFKFYPNPATTGSNITIEWKKPEAGEFEIQLLSQNGQIIVRRTESFVEKINSIQYSLPAVASGNYFLVMINRKTGKRTTEKIIIQ